MHAIITLTFYALTALIPLTFTTINSELFEFPKFILLFSGSLIIASAWLIDIFLFHIKPKFSRKPIHYAILLILITQTITTITSIHPYTSFWGYYGRYHQGLLTTICYTLIYFAATNYLDKKSTQKIIKISVYTSIIVSLYAILERFGIDKNMWVQDVVNRPFSTLGQPNWLAAYLIPNFFLTLYLSHNNQKKSISTIYYLLSTIYFATLILTKSRSGFLAFSLAYPVYWFLLARQFSFSKIKHSLILTTSYLILATIIIGIPWTQYFTRSGLVRYTNNQIGTQLETGGTESGDIRKIVWTGALDLIKHYPLLGTGPETFAYTYYWVRPIAHNMTSEWDFLYNKAHNEYLNIAATTGIIGLLAYLYYHFAVMRASTTLIPKTKKVDESDLDSLRAYYPVLGAVIVSFFITNFFGFSVIPVYFSTILLSALISSFTNPPHISYYLPTTSYLIFLLLLYPARLFLADLNYARGKAYLNAARPVEAIPLLSRATSARSAEALFASTLGEAYAQAGIANQARLFATQSLALNPHHLNFYKSRAKIYLTLGKNEQAATELEKARELAPTDPKLAYNLGLIYSRQDRPQETEKQLLDAIRLKPDYPDPYFALTRLYEQTNNTAPLPELLSRARANLATYSSQLGEKIEKYTLK